MQTIHHSEAYQRLVQRIEMLSSSATRNWGSMSIEEMLWHLRSQLEMALGKRSTHTNIRSYLRLPLFRWLAIYLIPWPKGAATAPEMHIKKANPALYSFEEEKRMLLTNLQDARDAEELHPHPLFGKLSKQDWGRLIWKHIDHHLRQFGA